VGQCAGQIESEQCIGACVIPIWGPESSAKGFPGRNQPIRNCQTFAKYIAGMATCHQSAMCDTK
jgi:hypothetical protein